PDPSEALECAIDVQRAFAERERGGSGEVLRVRMGLHTGEVIAEEGDFFGKNVILAARIAAQAGGGEILLSDQMREAAARAPSPIRCARRRAPATATGCASTRAATSSSRAWPGATRSSAPSGN